MAMAPKHLSYAIGATLVALVLVAFFTRRSDIDRIERVINQKVAAVTEAEEERIRAIVQHEVSVLVSGHERIPPNMIQTVAVGSDTRFSELWNERFAHHLARLKDEKREREETSDRSSDGLSEESTSAN